MSFIIRLLAVGAVLSASVNALSISSNEIVARAHSRHARRVDSDAIVEKAVEADLEERSTSKKIGLGWSGNSESNIPHWVSGKTKYIYTWSPYCPAKAAEHGLECCPMLWGTKQISQFQENKYKGGKCILGMNEVNVPSQGKLTVHQGVQLWNEYIRPMKKQGYYLVTPSVTSGDDGVTWLREFFQQCGGSGTYCQADALAFHYYGTTVSDFQKWANKFHAVFPHDIWVTEIACQNFGNPKQGQCNKDQVWNFMNGATKWMAETPWIKAHFFFGTFWDMYNVNTLNRMANKDGTPNALGHNYINGS